MWRVRISKLNISLVECGLKIVIDEYAAGVVRDIYQWKISGMSQQRIADKLNDMGVLSPAEYKKSCGIKYSANLQTKKQAIWSAVAITRILTNESYTGTLIQGKVTTPNYKVKKTVIKDEEDWVVIPNAFEAIITKEQFDMVQEILKKGVKDLRSVVLISCPNRMTPYDKEVNRLLDTLLAEDEMAFCRLLMLLSYRPEFVNENPLFYLTVYAKIQAAGVKSAMSQQLRQMIAMDTVDFELKGIKAMCVFGENDRLLRSDTLSRFQERIDGLRAEIIPGASHMLPEGELGKRLNHFYL